MNSLDRLHDFEEELKFTQKKGHTKENFLLALSKLFERASYYGVRAVIILYATSEFFDIEDSDVFFYYGLFTSLIVITQVIGGAIGDLLLGNKTTTILGAAMQLLGVVLLCIPNVLTLLVGAFLICIGSGFYSSNLLAIFGKSYAHNQKLLDAGFTLLYFFINVGAFVSVLFLGYIADKINYTVSFVCAGVMMVFSILFLLLENTKEQKELILPKINVGIRFLKIVIGVLLFSGFWMVYDMIGGNLFLIGENITEQIADNSLATILSPNSLVSFLSILFSAFFFLIWTYFQMNRFLKMTLGMFFGSIALMILSSLFSNTGDENISIFLIAMCFLGLAELLIGPILNSLVTKYTKPKFLALAMGLIYIPYQLISIGIRRLEELNAFSSISLFNVGIAITGGLVIIGVVYTFVDYKFIKN